MIAMGDLDHARLIARAARTGFDPDIDRVISRVARNGRFLGGMIYTGYTGTMIMCHVAGVGNWASPELVWRGFDYPFEYLKVRKIVCTVGAANHRSKDIIERLGFTLEHEIEEGTPTGPLLIYSMLRSECPWLKLRMRYMRLTGDTSHADDEA